MLHCKARPRNAAAPSKLRKDQTEGSACGLPEKNPLSCPGFQAMELAKIPAAKSAAASTTLCQPKQDQRERGGRCLHVQDSSADGRGAIDAGHDHAEQKECLDLECEA